MQFKKGEFRSYRATITFHLGTTQENVQKDEIVEFDGTTLRKEDGGEVKVSSVKGAVLNGWLVPEGDTESVYVPQSANVEVHPAQTQGNDRRKERISVTTVADDMAEVGTISGRKASREAKAKAADQSWATGASGRTSEPEHEPEYEPEYEPHYESNPDNDLVRELDAALGIDTTTKPKPKARPKRKAAAKPAQPKMPVATRDQQEVGRAVRSKVAASEGPIRGAEARTQATEGETIKGVKATVGTKAKHFAGADAPAGGVEVSGQRETREVVNADASEGVAIASLGSSKFKTDVTDGNQGRSVRSVRPKQERSASAERNRLLSLGRAIVNGDIAGELLEKLDPDQKAKALALVNAEDSGEQDTEPDYDSMTVEERRAARRAAADASEAAVTTTGDVEEAHVGENLEDLLPDAVSTGTPDPGEAGEGDDPHLTPEEKAEAADPKIEAIRAFVPDFDWDLQRPWKHRVSDAVENYADNDPWIRGILAVESDSVKKHIQAALDARSA